MNPITGEYHLLEAKTWTFSNSEGFEFMVEKTFFPPIKMEYIILDSSSCCPTSMLIHSPDDGRGLKYLAKLGFPPTAEDMRNPREE